MNPLLPRLLVTHGLCALLLLLLSACGGITLPRTVPLSPPEQQQALASLARLRQEHLPPSVETGYELSWEIMGSSGRVSALLQMDAPDHLRLGAYDPLGRTLYLAVADGRFFTLVDNRATLVRRGRIDGASWRALVPEPLVLEDVAPLLGGRLPARLPALIEAEENPERSGYWFAWTDTRGLEHRLLLDRERNLVARHIFLDRKKADILLDVSYLSYDEDRSSGYLWPRTTQVCGSLVRGTLVLERSGELSFDSLPLSVFHPELPPHFRVEHLR